MASVHSREYGFIKAEIKEKVWDDVRQLSQELSAKENRRVTHSETLSILIHKFWDELLERHATSA